MSTHMIQYSEKYYDDVYEYRHVILPKDMAHMVPKGRLMPEVGFGLCIHHFSCLFSCPSEQGSKPLHCVLHIG